MNKGNQRLSISMKLESRVAEIIITIEATIAIDTDFVIEKCIDKINCI